MTDRLFGSNDPETLRRQLVTLQAEVDALRTRLSDAPRTITDLERRLADTSAHLDRSLAQNDKLSNVLEEAREQLSVLRAEVEKLTMPPNNFATVLGVNSDGSVDIMQGNRKLRVAAQPSIEVKKLQKGQEVLLNESSSIIDTRDYLLGGDVVRIRDKLADGRLLVMVRGDDEQVVGIADSLADVPVRIGDHVRLDSRSGMAFERLQRPEVEELVLEEVPDITYEQVGGLMHQIEEIRDAVELPYFHKELFGEYGSNRRRASCCTDHPAAARR